MKNPLFKRLPREIKNDFGKHLALFLFLTLTIGFVSGFLVGDNSLKKSYDESFEKYTVEDGHFVLSGEADKEMLSELENEEDITVYPLFYKNKENELGHSIRIYKFRNDVNKVDLMKGNFPSNDGEIAIDRLYAENNDIAVGDSMVISGKTFKVTGYTAFTDYSCLFKNNTDMMFDANKFTVALVTDSDFDSFGEAGLEYCYAWIDSNRSMTEKEQKDKSEEIMKFIAVRAEMTDFVARPDNNAIMFTGDDMGGDKVMMQTLLYIVIAILAFAFAVTTRSTIEQEAPVIGTLRASGYTKGEILAHYIALPVIVTLAAAVVGNIIGYTLMKDYVAGMYMHSYSLTTYVTLWNAEAFILTTLIPAVIIFVVNLIVIGSSLSASPLQFIRRDFSKNRRKKAVKLPEWKFLSRFRARVILQNIPAYITLFAGIFLSSVLLLFGLMFTPLLKEFKNDVVKSKFADYQYILKYQAETSDENAEKYCVSSLDNSSDEGITIYGIESDSKYVKEINVNSERVYVSSAYSEKYGLESGDSITLHDKYSKEEYKFTVAGVYEYPASLCIFISRSYFNSMFDKSEDYFTGYLSNTRLDDINEAYIATIITEHDLTIMADQLDDSMGRMFPMFGGFGIIIFMLMIYLLAKLIIERNASSISMVKILGYSAKEASKLYSSATAVVVMLSLLISVPLCSAAIKAIYYAMMMSYNGWLTFYIAPWIYPTILVMGGAGYFAVSIVLMSKIKKIPLSQALKNME